MTSRGTEHTHFRLPTAVMPVGTFRKRYRTRVRDVVRTRSVQSFRTQRHRSGWPWVAAALAERSSDDGILLDDFVERTFHPTGWGTPTRMQRLQGVAAEPLTWQEPWIGIFHNPPEMPEWFQDQAHPAAIFAGDRFEKSSAHLRGGIALSEHLARWLQMRLGIPVLAIKHPTEFPARRFTWTEFVRNPEKQLVQVGWYLRNYRAIYQVPVPGYLQKVHLAQDQWFVKAAQERTDAHSPHRDRPDRGTVRVQSWLSPEAYDAVFSRNLVFLELFDASANNVVIEAIVRETPVVVNRHPAVVEYLGEDYPLFYQDLSEVADLLSLNRIASAHEYLRAMDKSDLTLEHFIARVEEFATLISRP